MEEFRSMRKRFSRSLAQFINLSFCVRCRGIPAALHSTCRSPLARSRWWCSTPGRIRRGSRSYGVQAGAGHPLPRTWRNSPHTAPWCPHPVREALPPCWAARQDQARALETGAPWAWEPWVHGVRSPTARRLLAIRSYTRNPVSSRTLAPGPDLRTDAVAAGCPRSRRGTTPAASIPKNACPHCEAACRATQTLHRIDARPLATQQ
jgi:hypothetical protein